MRKILICGMILLTVICTGCSSKDDIIYEDSSENVEETINDNVEEKREYTVFSSIGGTYEKTGDIKSLDSGYELFNNNEGYPYERGVYMEADYAYDCIQRYLEGDKSIYEYMINIDGSSESGYTAMGSEGESELDESLKFLKEQMGISEDEPIYFRMSKAVYEGADEGIEDSCVLSITGHVSIDNVNFQSLSKFTVTIVPEEDRLLVNII